ncbi:MAG: hypothetical protein JWO96_837 [Candidatus Saccharibacteria bacterium]|nr:hypothetical protein [Candidatus Saccharibacteria bacterium]
MAFGPESTNPRERRAYAHMKIAKLAIGKADYGEALQAAYLANGTQKGKGSHFDEALENAKASITRKEKGSSGHYKIRRVPLNWKHPKDSNGYHIPLYDSREAGGYTISELEEEIEAAHITSDYFAERYMPAFGDVPEEEMGICLYDTVVEGVPLTPVYPDTPQGCKDLASYASEYVATVSDHTGAQYWEERLFGDLDQPQPAVHQ